MVLFLGRVTIGLSKLALIAAIQADFRISSVKTNY
jgi:hypothetical protein